MLFRSIFNNLFSNILKYGDKRRTVTVSGRVQDAEFIVSVTNLIKIESPHIDSSNIGLRNVDRMIRLLHGRLQVMQEKEHFEVKLYFPLQ